MRKLSSEEKVSNQSQLKLHKKLTFNQDLNQQEQEVSCFKPVNTNQIKDDESRQVQSRVSELDQFERYDVNGQKNCLSGQHFPEHADHTCSTHLQIKNIFLESGKSLQKLNEQGARYDTLASYKFRLQNSKQQSPQNLQPHSSASGGNQQQQYQASYQSYFHYQQQMKMEQLNQLSIPPPNQTRKHSYGQQFSQRQPPQRYWPIQEEQWDKSNDEEYYQAESSHAAALKAFDVPDFGEGDRDIQSVQQNISKCSVGRSNPPFPTFQAFEDNIHNEELAKQYVDENLMYKCEQSMSVPLGLAGNKSSEKSPHNVFTYNNNCELSLHPSNQILREQQNSSADKHDQSYDILIQQMSDRNISQEEGQARFLQMNDIDGNMHYLDDEEEDFGESSQCSDPQDLSPQQKLLAQQWQNQNQRQQNNWQGNNSNQGFSNGNQLQQQKVFQRRGLHAGTHGELMTQNVFTNNNNRFEIYTVSEQENEGEETVNHESAMQPVESRYLNGELSQQNLRTSHNHRQGGMISCFCLNKASFSINRGCVTKSGLLPYSQSQNFERELGRKAGDLIYEDVLEEKNLVHEDIFFGIKPAGNQSGNNSLCKPRISCMKQQPSGLNKSASILNKSASVLFSVPEEIPQENDAERYIQEGASPYTADQHLRQLIQKKRFLQVPPSNYQGSDVLHFSHQYSGDFNPQPSESVLEKRVSSNVLLRRETTMGLIPADEHHYDEDQFEEQAERMQRLCQTNIQFVNTMSLQNYKQTHNFQHYQNNQEQQIRNGTHSRIQDYHNNNQIREGQFPNVHQYFDATGQILSFNMKEQTIRDMQNPQVVTSSPLVAPPNQQQQLVEKSAPPMRKTFMKKQTVYIDEKESNLKDNENQELQIKFEDGAADEEELLNRPSMMMRGDSLEATDEYGQAFYPPQSPILSNIMQPLAQDHLPEDFNPFNQSLKMTDVQFNMFQSEQKLMKYQKNNLSTKFMPSNSAPHFAAAQTGNNKSNIRQ